MIDNSGENRIEEQLCATNILHMFQMPDVVNFYSELTILTSKSKTSILSLVTTRTRSKQVGLNWAKLSQCAVRQSTGIDVTGHGTNKIVVGSQWIKKLI